MRASMIEQQGQATAEFAIFALAMVPVLWMVIVMTRIAGLADSVRQSSQYLVWDKVFSPEKSADQLARQVKSLFFSGASTSVKPQDQQSLPAAAGPRSSLPAYDAPLFDVSRVVASGSSGTPGASARAFRPFGSLYVRGLGLSPQGQWHGRVNVPLNEPSEHRAGIPDYLMQALPERLRSDATLLQGEWNATGPENIRARLSSPIVTLNDSLLPGITRTIANIFYFADLERNPQSFRNGNADPDSVPCDLLQGGRPVC